MNDLLALLAVICAALALALTVVLLRIIRELWRRYGDRRYLVWGMIAVLAFNVTWIASQVEPEPVRMIYPPIPNLGRFIAPEPYRASVTKWAAYYKIPQDIAVRLGYEESRWNPKAVNRNDNGSADYGLYQLNSYYFPMTTIDENIELGLRHLAEAYKATGSWRKSVIAYNAGLNGSKNPPVRSLRHADRVVGGKIMKYLIMAYRYGTEEYSFPVGLFDDEMIAIEAATNHRLFRGLKYDHKLYYVTPGEPYDAEECKWRWVTGELVGGGL